MPLAVDISTFGATVIVLGAVVLGFVLGKIGGKEVIREKASPLPSKRDLEAMQETIHGWLELGDQVGGMKAAVYAAIGVIVGAAGGLAADWVTTGDMSPSQIGRAIFVLVVAFVLSLIFIVIVEVAKPIERLMNRGNDG
jgi:hypothetical protein